MRVYAWRDALQLVANKPAAGHGAGAFALLSTGLSAPDCVRDPLAMSGQVSSDAHCEPLELLADLGVFGGVIGLAIWGFALAAAIGRASGPDRWLAAAVAGAVAAAFVDAASGVSWRLPGPAPFLAMPAALAWMLCREAIPPNPAGRRGWVWVSLVPALVGIGAGAAGAADFAAARFLYRAQSGMQQAERALVRGGQASTSQEARERRRQAEAAASAAIEQSDLAARWHMDPVRRLVALLVGGQLRASLGYLPQLPGSTPADLASGQQALNAGLAVLQRLEAMAPGYADTFWRMAELLDAKASLAGLAQDPAQAAAWRQEALGLALQYFGTQPLHGERIWQSFGIWPEIPPAQRLSLLRGTLRDEAEVSRQQRPAAAAYTRWAQQREYVARMWEQLGEQAGSVENSFLELGYSALRVPYRQWQDPLTPEGVRVAAVRRVLQGEPAQAADALDMASLLYEQAGGLLPYSQAAVNLDLAACRLRQGIDQAAWAGAAIAEGRRILGPLPANPIRRQLLELADALQQGIDAAGGANIPSQADAWRVAVDLFWDMPPARWPTAIQIWAQRADAGYAAQGVVGTATLQLLIGRGEAEAAWALVQRMPAQPAARASVQTALREAGSRWPARRELVATLLQRVDGND